MAQFEFETDLEQLDYRSKFANRVLKLIYQKHKGDLDASIIEAEIFFEEFEELIRNIYELVEDEIPLYAYYQLLKHGAKDYGMGEEEYTDAIAASVDACRIYYAE